MSHGSLNNNITKHFSKIKITNKYQGTRIVFSEFLLFHVKFDLVKYPKVS